MRRPIAGAIDQAQDFAGLGQADHERMIAPGAVVGDVHAGLARAGGLGERAVHVEEDGADIPFSGHATLARCSASLRKQAGQRQSLPSTGTGIRKASSLHQHGPDRLQLNSVPQAVQARRRVG